LFFPNKINNLRLYDLFNFALYVIGIRIDAEIINQIVVIINRIINANIKIFDYDLI